MEFDKFFSEASNRRRPSLIREWAAAYLRMPTGITLANGMPNADTFPFEEITVTCKDGTHHQLTGKELQASLQYGPSKGFPPLLKAYREFQERVHHPKTDNWDLAMTCGSQDACSKLFEILVNPGDPVLMQTPLYTGTIGAIAPFKPEFLGIEQDEDGIIPEAIERVCSDRRKNNLRMPKLLYVNPTGSNPTASILSLSRRVKIYELAQKYDFIILEDDPYYFVHFMENEIPSIFSLDTEGRVVRMDSFSKVISAGFRVGIVSGHPLLIERLVLHTESSTMHPPSVSQMILYKLLNAWTAEQLQNHFRYIQKFYRNHRDVMLAALDKHLTGLAEWAVPKAGMFVWITVTCLDDVMELAAEKCFAERLFVLPGHAFRYETGVRDNHLRLAYSYATPQEIDKGLEILAKLIRESKNETKG